MIQRDTIISFFIELFSSIFSIPYFTTLKIPQLFNLGPFLFSTFNVLLFSFSILTDLFQTLELTFIIKKPAISLNTRDPDASAVSS